MNPGAGASPEGKMDKMARRVLIALAFLLVLLPVKVCWTKYSYTVSPLGIQVRVNGEMGMLDALASLKIGMPGDGGWRKECMVIEGDETKIFHRAYSLQISMGNDAACWWVKEFVREPGRYEAWVCQGPTFCCINQGGKVVVGKELWKSSDGSGEEEMKVVSVTRSPIRMDTTRRWWLSY